MPIVSLRGTETILLLERHGYAVIEAARPEDALALADSSQAVDLLLTDIVMPGVGGRALAAQFAARRPGTLVLFMSGYPAAAIGRHQMLERGSRFCRNRSARRRWHRRSGRCWGRGGGLAAPQGVAENPQSYLRSS